MKFKVGPMAYISRMAYAKSAPGWWVKFVRSGVYLAQKKFNDSEFGGEANSLIVATKWRDGTLKELIKNTDFRPLFAGHRKPAFLTARRGSIPGRVGIMKLDNYWFRTTTQTAIHAYAWKATWVQYVVEHGKVVRKQTYRTFSIHKFGERDAFFKAQTARKNAEKFLMTSEQSRLRNEYKNNEIMKRGRDSKRI